MRIISLELKNIRSYRDGTIEIPTGITLLSGDIGAGKSTILLAIEFALFGLSRGELVGSALLRHGANEGRVTLTFNIQGQVQVISRTLKRSASGVSQDTGYLESNGGRELLTPSELRARVYGLLGYPMQFLAKQKNLLYRFTIYTPQEEMKSILVQASEERLETIRRIFGIDAYRIARDNAHIVSKSLREQEVVHEAILPRLAQDAERFNEKLKRAPELQQQHELLLKERTHTSAFLKTLEQQLTDLEKERMQIQHEQQMQQMQERTRNVGEQELRNLQLQLDRKEKMLRDTQELVLKLRSTHALFAKELEGLPATQQLQTRQQEALSQLERFKLEEGKILAIIDQCKHDPTLAGGSICPTCRQEVSSAHVQELQSSLQAQETAAKRKQEKLLARIAEQRQELQRLQQLIDRRRQLDDVTQQLALQEKLLQQQSEESKLLSQNIATKRAALPPPIVPDAARVERSRKLEQQMLETRGVVLKHRQQLADIEKRLGRLEQEEKELAEAREQLVVLGAERLQREQQMMRAQQIRSWVTRQFTPFTSTVERHVLMSIHMTFDAVFRQWFNRLIEDDALSTRIDHEFAPLMLQHGYEADVAFLSGGERTAVSLAYRLALVHTIHVMLPHLGTSGVIMLDEPTDGFSSEQLERVRDVLRELRMEQIILVSHEQQLEGFVDHILRVRKTGDGSLVEIAA